MGRTATFRQRADRQQFPAESSESAAHSLADEYFQTVTLPTTSRKAGSWSGNQAGQGLRCFPRRLPEAGDWGWLQHVTNVTLHPKDRHAAEPPRPLPPLHAQTDGLNEERSVGWWDGVGQQLASSGWCVAMGVFVDGNLGVWGRVYGERRVPATRVCAWCSQQVPTEVGR